MSGSSDEVAAHGAIPMLDLRTEVEELWDEINAAIQRVLRSGRFILGPEVEAFEEEVAEFLGTEHAIGVNSGTDALVIGLRALGIGPGDEVITTPFTFFATAEAILHVGATPVFVDVEPDTFNVDPELILQAITARTKAIVPVHLFGKPAAMGRIMAIAREHGLRVLEDAAQSFGARVRADPDAGVAARGPEGAATGAIGDVGAYSFYPTKNLSSYGDGGLVVTDHPDLAEHARALRNHGQPAGTRNLHTEVGYNSRLDAMQAAILRVKLKHVEDWNARRRRLAERYEAELAGCSGLELPTRTEDHVFHQYTIRVVAGSRNALAEGLRARGIASSVFYPRTITLDGSDGRSCACPVATRLAGEVLSLPIWPAMPDEAIRAVSAAVQDTLAGVVA